MIYQSITREDRKSGNRDPGASRCLNEQGRERDMMDRAGGVGRLSGDDIMASSDLPGFHIH